MYKRKEYVFEEHDFYEFKYIIKSVNVFCRCINVLIKGIKFM